MQVLHLAVLSAIAFVVNVSAASVADKTAIAGTLPIDTTTNRFLRTHYTDEERAFGLNLIPGGKKVSNLLTDKKLSKYLNNDREIDEVFSKLKLNTAGAKLFENPKFLAWSKYVDDFNQKHQTQHSMLPTLVRQYGGDDLSIMLEKAKQADKTYGVALRLQGEQMKLWRREGLTTDQLFKIYKLDDGSKNLLGSQELKIWTRYADEFISPGDSTNLFKQLQKSHSDETLSQILIQGKKVSSTEKLASDLQNQQVNHWLDTLVPPEKVFKFLALDKGAENVLASPQLQSWLRYAGSYNSLKNPFLTKVSLIDVLTKHYSNSALATMLKSSTATSTYSKRMAAVIEGDLLTKWAKAGKPAEYVTNMLGTTPAQIKKLEAAYSLKLRAVRYS
ncbi:hypothetical protein P3T76_010612 [Phytophthora citrophthora]|uniref:RxLR effector PexRD54 WY domain-containing protein n=1 Tax=Phytophthora citrophthora TaxID=4793 RepID=A0AAD9GBQ2_9STRA|nr:hypothetical protein P3T76_010612 [Phytophthora citrophthora]